MNFIFRVLNITSQYSTTHVPQFCYIDGPWSINYYTKNSCKKVNTHSLLATSKLASLILSPQTYTDFIQVFRKYLLIYTF